MLKRIAIVAGETSGDLLAARLILALKALNPELVFEGIAGPEMQAAGCVSLFPMERLSVMGLAEVLKHLPSLLKIRGALVKRWHNNPPDLFIGVDAPDFNLPLAGKLRRVGIRTAHYVSPSVWAWRAYRVKKMRQQLDVVLCLFPFEVDFYQRHELAAEFVGHPLADEIQFDGNKVAARRELALPEFETLLAILPGSRRSEVERLGKVFFETAQLLQNLDPDLQIIIPTVNDKLLALLEAQRLKVAPDLLVTYQNGQSRQLMQAADYLLMASGTAVLEGMLSGRLMVAAYRVSGLTMWILRRFKLLKVKFVTLPNNLAGEALVPEVLQEQVTPAYLAEQLEALFQLPETRRNYIMQRFKCLHSELKRDASASAARALMSHFNHA
ncbi:lipid-A-disaccharide synthase [Thiolinea disciformis]|uniref:lipid-A-disaccharide synthase n=1 Tax=Thiolinea disciformis TaxID=125614 RepID=UPI000374B80E|nr:lipid-A-disaccharide synthase [Thiolinea disciformis]